MASTADQRRAFTALAAERRKEGAGKRILKRAAAVILALFLIAIPVLWAAGFFSTPQAVAEVEQAVAQQVAEYDRVARGEVPFGSTPSSRAVFEKARDLPPRYRDQVGQQMAQLWEARERAEIASYFFLPADKRQAELDRRIKAEEDRRKQWQAEREQRDQARSAAGLQAGSRGPGGRGGGGPGGPGGQGPGGGPAGRWPGGGPGGSGVGGPRGSRSQEAWNERSKRRIDQSTPEQRARQTEYRRALEERRSQLGIPPGGGRRG